jgi:hypothetical protein
MERAQSSVQPLLHASVDEPREESGPQRNDGPPSTNATTNTPGDFGGISPLHANETRDELGRFGHGSPLLTYEEPSIQPLFNDGDIELNMAP